MTHRILAVDDHPDTLNAVVDMLRGYGYTMLSTHSPFEGLEIAEAELPDLILLDVNMPDMDGVEFARRLRSQAQLADIPIIMFTAEYLPAQKLAGFEAGADDYLLKPTDPETLVNRIQALLGEPSNQEALPESKAPVAEDAAAAGPPPGKVIVLLGAHGGAGTTTLSFNLALALAEAGTATVLVDGDMTQGHVALYLNQRDFSRTLNQFVQQPASPASVRQNLVPYDDNLHLLLSEPDPLAQTSPPDQAQIAVLLQTLVEEDCCVIIDLGRGLSAAARTLVEQADEVIVCMQPTRVGLASARYLLHKLEKEWITKAHLTGIAFHMGSSSIPAEPIENYLKRPLLAIVTVHPRDLVLSTNRAEPLIHIDQSEAGSTIREIAGQITNR